MSPYSNTNPERLRRLADPLAAALQDSAPTWAKIVYNVAKVGSRYLMGTPIPDVDPVWGLYCAACDMHWPYPYTPKYLFIKFRGMMKCPPPGSTDAPPAPNDQWFMLEQQTACFWSYYDYDTYSISYYADKNGFTKVMLGHPAHDKTYFINEGTLEKCTLGGWNQIECGPVGYAAADGYFIVTDGVSDPTIPILLTETYGFRPGPLNIFEPELSKIGSHSIRIANTADKTNVLFRYETTSGPSSKHIVTGTLSPDATGDYFYDGIFNGKPSHKRTVGDTYYLYWFSTPVNGWAISTAKSTAAPWNGWYRSDPNIEGDYLPVGPAQGTATVTLNVTPLTVSGTLDPDAEGTYRYVGFYNGKYLYQRRDGAYHVAWYGMSPNDWALVGADPNNPLWAWTKEGPYPPGGYHEWVWPLMFERCYGMPGIHDVLI